MLGSMAQPLRQLVKVAKPDLCVADASPSVGVESAPRVPGTLT